MSSSSGPIQSGLFLIKNAENGKYLKLSSNNRIEGRPMRGGTTSPSTRMIWIIDQQFDGYHTIRNAARNESYASIQYDIEEAYASIVFTQNPCSWAIVPRNAGQYTIRSGNPLSSRSMYWELTDDTPGAELTLEESPLQECRWKLYPQRRTPAIAPPSLPYTVQNIFNPSRIRIRPPRPEEEEGEPSSHPILKYFNWLGDSKKEPVYGASGSKTDSKFEPSSSKGKDKPPIRTPSPILMLPEDDTSEHELHLGITIPLPGDVVDPAVVNAQAEDEDAAPIRFNDATDAPEDLSITRITDITIRHYGTVFGIQVTYILGDGRVFAPSHGNPSVAHNEDRVILSETESIVEVRGTASSGIIWQLAFVIRDFENDTERICGPFGDDVNFGSWPGLYRFKVSGRIIAFGGKCTPTMLTGISCITDGAPPVTEVEMEKDVEVESDDNDA